MWIVFVVSVVMCTLYSCNNHTEYFDSKQAIEVRDSVTRMMASISNDVTLKGPTAWAQYFEDVPEFYMANDGKLQLSDGDSAQNFVKNILISKINKIELQWSNIRIDAYTNTLADVAANYREYIINSDGKMISVFGYFTGVAQKTGKRWQLRNAHWSSVK